jgi:uncharacterized protein (UPF0210 family)
MRDVLKELKNVNSRLNVKQTIEINNLLKIKKNKKNKKKPTQNTDTGSSKY